MKKLLLALGLSSILGVAQAQSLTTSGMAEASVPPAGGDARPWSPHQADRSRSWRGHARPPQRNTIRP